MFSINATTGVTDKVLKITTNDDFVSFITLLTGLLTYVFLLFSINFVSNCTSPCLFLSVSPSSHSDGVGTRRKLYSAVPGRHFVVVRPYTAQAEGEINLYKSDRVKGETDNNLSFLLVFVQLHFHC